MSGSRFYSPLVRSIAKQEGLSLGELETVQGSGLGGRVNKNDILNYVQRRRSGGMTSAQAPAFKTAQPAPATPKLDFSKGDLVIPMDNIRQKIAEHMVRSKHTSAHVTSVTEVDVTEIVKFREKFKDEFKLREGVSLTYTPIFIDAMVRAIKDFPIINASVDGTNIVVKKDINFGVAVSLPPVENSPLPPALIVPVIKKAQDLSMPAIARAVSELAGKARNKKLSPDDISGSTFTLTNPGMFGNLFGTPIINQPNVAIMTTGAVVKRVVVKTDEAGTDYMAIRSMMFLGLSYDHRLVDGQYGVQFTERVKYYLENFRSETA
jgi:2-oxoglutarate dehydrogenase E2 component (dihydrolipoamide succinyltransferase)